MKTYSHANAKVTSPNAWYVEDASIYFGILFLSASAAIEYHHDVALSCATPFPYSATEWRLMRCHHIRHTPSRYIVNSDIPQLLISPLPKVIFRRWGTTRRFDGHKRKRCHISSSSLNLGGNGYLCQPRVTRARHGTRRDARWCFTFGRNTKACAAGAYVSRALRYWLAAVCFHEAAATQYRFKNMERCSIGCCRISKVFYGPPPPPLLLPHDSTRCAMVSLRRRQSFTAFIVAGRSMACRHTSF